MLFCDCATKSHNAFHTAYHKRRQFGNFLFLISAFMFSKNDLCRSVGEVYISAIV